MTITVDPDLDPAPSDREAELTSAQLRLDVAIAQLVQPGIEQLDRDDPAASPAAAEVAAEDEAELRRLRIRHKSQMAAERFDEARQTLRRVVAVGQRIGQRTARQAHLPSLVEQLIDAIPGSGNTDHGTGSAGSTRSAVALDVLDLVHAMQAATRCRTLRGLSDALRAWTRASGHWRTTDPELLLWAATAAESWVSAARTLLNPPKRWSMAAACPQCETSVTYVQDSSGERVRRPALELDPTTQTARCLAPGCGARWDSRRLLLLAQMLEEQQARMLTEVAG